MNIWLPSYLSAPFVWKMLAKESWGWGGDSGRGKQNEWWWKLQTENAQFSNLHSLNRKKDRCQTVYVYHHEITCSNYSASSKCLMSDCMNPANHNLLPEGLRCFDRSGNHVNTIKSIQIVNQHWHNRSTHVIWGPVIWDGRVLTDLGSGAGQRKTPFWSNMAYLTGLGSGRVQSTAGAALTMTALWQVYLRWSCLMYAHPLFSLHCFPHYLFPIRHIDHSFPIPVSLCFICFHLSVVLPSSNCSICPLFLLLAS